MSHRWNKHNSVAFKKNVCMLRFCTFTSPYTVNFKNVKPTFSSTSFDVVEQHSMSSNCYTFKAASSSLLIKNVHKHGIFFERRSHLLKRLFNINCQWGCWRQSSTFKAWEVKIKCHALLLWFLFSFWVWGQSSFCSSPVWNSSPMFTFMTLEEGCVINKEMLTVLCR